MKCCGNCKFCEPDTEFNIGYCDYRNHHPLVIPSALVILKFRTMLLTQGTTCPCHQPREKDDEQ